MTDANIKARLKAAREGLKNDIYPIPANYKALQNIDDSLNDIPGLLEENKALRKLVWLSHGCNNMPYGDDGEMQCCGIDFKRLSVEDIVKIFETRGEKLIREHLHLMDGEK